MTDEDTGMETTANKKKDQVGMDGRDESGLLLSTADDVSHGAMPRAKDREIEKAD